MGPAEQRESSSVVAEEVSKPVDELKSKDGMSLTSKDYGWLRKTHYEEVRMNFRKTFVLQHKLFPKKIIELRGASAVHACSFIHWKPNQVRLLEVREDQVVEPGVVKPVSTVMSGSTSVV